MFLRIEANQKYTFLDAEKSNISLFFIQVVVTVFVMKGTYLNTSFSLLDFFSLHLVFSKQARQWDGHLFKVERINRYSQDLHHYQLRPTNTIGSVTIRPCFPQPLFQAFQKHISHDLHHQPHIFKENLSF